MSAREAFVEGVFVCEEGWGCTQFYHPFTKCVLSDLSLETSDMATRKITHSTFKKKKKKRKDVESSKTA